MRLASRYKIAFKPAYSVKLWFRNIPERLKCMIADRSEIYKPYNVTKYNTDYINSFPVEISTDFIQ
jgi:hypothetical protein